MVVNTFSFHGGVVLIADELVPFKSQDTGGHVYIGKLDGKDTWTEKPAKIYDPMNEDPYNINSPIVSQSLYPTQHDPSTNYEIERLKGILKKNGLM